MTFDTFLHNLFFLSNFSKARKLLKKKRYLENLLSQCDGQLETIQQMIDSIEFAQIEIEVREFTFHKQVWSQSCFEVEGMT